MKLKGQLPEMFSRIRALQLSANWRLGILLLSVGVTSLVTYDAYGQFDRAIAPLNASPDQVAALKQAVVNWTIACVLGSAGLSGLAIAYFQRRQGTPPSPPDRATAPELTEPPVELPLESSLQQTETFTSYQWDLTDAQEDDPSPDQLQIHRTVDAVTSIYQPDASSESMSHILMVDGDLAGIQVLKQFLKFHNYTLSAVLDGQEALALLARGFSPDLMLLNLEQGGYEVLDGVRQQFSTEQIPVILLSADHQLEDIMLGLERGANDYLTKPIIKDELLACIHTHLQSRKLQQETSRLTAAHERQLSQFLEALPVGVSVHNPDGSIFYFNQMAHHLLYQGHSLAVTVEQFAATYGIYQAGTEQLYPTEQLPLTKALQGECVIIEDLAIHQESRCVPLEVRGTPVYDEQGQIIYALVTFQDITERKRADKILSNYFHQLELEVSQRTTELASTNAQLHREIQERLQVEQALQIANQELQRLVNVDGLTQIANRRCFDQRLQWEWQRSMRDGTPLALILLDVDYFKRYNDYFGHQAGDTCLIQVVQAAVGVINRASDLVARYGGEEFAVILPGTDRSGAIAVADKIQRAIAALQILHPQSDISPYLTISMGIASEIPGLNRDIESLIASADQALYRAKQQGRNRYCTEVNQRRD